MVTKMNDRPIGNIFSLKGELYKVVEARMEYDTCIQCDLNGKVCWSLPSPGQCSMNHRQDRKSIVFKKLSKENRICQNGQKIRV